MLCNNLCSKTRDSFYTRFEKKKNILEQKSMDMGCGVMAFVANEKIISLWTACRRDSRQRKDASLKSTFKRYHRNIRTTKVPRAMLKNTTFKAQSYTSHCKLH